MFTAARRNGLLGLPPVPIRLMPLLVLASLVVTSPPSKAEALNLAEHSVCITATRAGQTLTRRVDCGNDAAQCRFAEGQWKTPGFFGLKLTIHPLQAEYVLINMDALGGVVWKNDTFGSPLTATAESLKSSAGFQTGMADPTDWSGQYDGTAVFRLVPKGASCESPAAAPAAAASGAPAAGQSWSDWFWSWFE